MKISIIGGATGSGKTTLILDLAKYLSNRGEKIGVIVQETGEIDYDEKTLEDYGIKTQQVNSVCIPCSLDADIRTNLLILQDEFNPDTVFIEAEETVIPHKLKADIERMKLDDTQLLPAAVIINSADCETEADQLTEYARKQLEGADILCINMSEKDDDKHIEKIRSMLYKLNPYAKIIISPELREEAFLKILLF